MRIAWRYDLHMTQHLADNDLEVVIMNIGSGRAVDTLGLLEQVACECITSLQAQHILQIEGARDERIATSNMLPIAYQQCPAARNTVRTHLIAWAEWNDADGVHSRC